MTRKYPIVEGEIYHVYNRGSDKRQIVQDEQDEWQFLSYLYLCNNPEFTFTKSTRDSFAVERSGSLVDIGAYCLMPNHFHLLAYEKMAGGLAKFMQRLGTAYSMYYNGKYKRTGSLFEGSYKAKLVDSDEYLNYLFAYIHLNPAKIVDSNWREVESVGRAVEIQKFLERYRPTSLVYYLGKHRKEDRILETKNFPAYFATKSEFERFIADWLMYRTVGEAENFSNTARKKVAKKFASL